MNQTSGASSRETERSSTTEQAPHRAIGGPGQGEGDSGPGPGQGDGGRQQGGEQRHHGGQVVFVTHDRHSLTFSTCQLMTLASHFFFTHLLSST